MATPNTDWGAAVFVACERARGPTAGKFARRRPWLIAFAFGLLHGLAFAGALANVGLRLGQAPQALLLFNLGAELDQLSFVGAVLLVTTGLRRLHFWSRIAQVRAVQLAPVYLIGALASYWMIERTIAAVALPA